MKKAKANGESETGRKWPVHNVTNDLEVLRQKKIESPKRSSVYAVVYDEKEKKETWLNEERFGRWRKMHGEEGRYRVTIREEGVGKKIRR